MIIGRHTEITSSDGRTMTLAKWAAILKLHPETLRRRAIVYGLDSVAKILEGKDRRASRLPRRIPVKKVTSKPETAAGHVARTRRVLGIYGLWQLSIERGMARCVRRAQKIDSILTCQGCAEFCRFSPRRKITRDHQAATQYDDEKRFLDLCTASDYEPLATVKNMALPWNF